MSWLDRFRPPAVPEAVSVALGRDEHVLALAPLVSGGTAVVTRYGLYLLADAAAVAERVPWHLVSKARLDAGTLGLTIADEVGTLPSGAVVLRDRAPVEIRPDGRNKLTDVVHSRVRGSVVASQRLDGDRASGWVALRSVAGRDGLIVQFRPDAGVAGSSAEMDVAVAGVAGRLLVTAGRMPVEE